MTQLALTVLEAASIGRSKVFEEIREGRLRAVKVGRGQGNGRAPERRHKIRTGTAPGTGVGSAYEGVASMQVPNGSRSGDARQNSRWGNAVLLIVSLLAPLFLLEIGYRVVAGLSVLKLANWRTDQVVMVNLGELKAVFDPELGWTSRASSYHEDGYTTIEHGVRKNFDETAIRTGAALAVGDSFTEGWEVKDHESWPAYLEKLTTIPVVNAGVGATGRTRPSCAPSGCCRS